MSQKYNCTFGKITTKNLEQFKMINSKGLPVQYKDEFYLKMITLYKQYTYLVYFNDYAVGCISCRVEERDGIQTLYILTLSILERYRRLGIGTQIIQFILKQLLKENPEVQAMFLHVQASNSTAIQFYQKFGFFQVELIKDYYKNLDVNDCCFLKKNIYN